MNRHEVAGQNRFEMLVFTVSGQDFGINVFKVKEITTHQKINSIPGSHKNVLGVTTVRGKPMVVIDLAKVIGSKPSDTDNGLFIITEYNRQVQAIKIDQVKKIENCSWESVQEPPRVGSKRSYLTGVANMPEQLIQILDVEKILSEIADEEDEIISIDKEIGRGRRILIVDDSRTALNQLSRCIEPLGFSVDKCKNGEEALKYLQELQDGGIDPAKYLTMMITDIEMPKMDGYTLVTKARELGMQDLEIIMHTSMSGIFNEAMVQKVGANHFLPKFKPQEIQDIVISITSQDNQREQRIAA